jgi:hypothetical protein
MMNWRVICALLLALSPAARAAPEWACGSEHGKGCRCGAQLVSHNICTTATMGSTPQRTGRGTCCWTGASGHRLPRRPLMPPLSPWITPLSPWIHPRICMTILPTGACEHGLNGSRSSRHAHARAGAGWLVTAKGTSSWCKCQHCVLSLADAAFKGWLVVLRHIQGLGRRVLGAWYAACILERTESPAEPVSSAARMLLCLPVDNPGCRQVPAEPVPHRWKPVLSRRAVSRYSSITGTLPASWSAMSSLNKL